MKRMLNLLLLSFLMIGVVTLQYGCGSSEPAVVEPIDSDGDGITDEDEIANGTDPNKADSDDDGLSDREEAELGTDPNNADTDGDGLSDGDEVNSYNTNPLNADTDGDGLSDGDEVNRYRTDPNDANGDADGDGVSDVDEIRTYNTDPNRADSDGDGFTDGQEIEMSTDPNNSNDPVYIDSNALKTINFDFDKSSLRDDAATALADNVRLLTDAPGFRVRVDAYTDHIGGDQYNLRLSLRRARAVVDFYTSNGIAEDRIDSRGLGKAPVPCSTEDAGGRGCERNRRAESAPISPYKYRPNR